MKEKQYKIGTTGIAARDLEAFSGTIKKGDRVQIVGIDEVQPSRGYELLDLDTGLKLSETGFNSIIPDTIDKTSEETETYSETINNKNNKEEKRFKIGTVGTAAEDLEAFSGTIKKGDRVQIVGIDEVQPSRGYELLDLDTGLKLSETGFNSIIPAKYGEIVFDIGTIGIATEDLEAFSGTIKKGDRVQIVGIDEYAPSRGYELLDLDTGLKLTETGFNSIIPIVSEKEDDMNKSGRKL